MSSDDEFLEWIENQDGGYLNPDRVDEVFPDVDYSLAYCTGRINPETGEIQYPARDFRRGLNGPRLD